MSKLILYLRKLKVFNNNDNRKPFNLQSMYSTTSDMKPGKYFIDKTNADTFINKYYKYTFEEKKESTLLECTFKNSNKPSFDGAYENANPIKIDIDLKFKLTDNERQSKEYKRIYTRQNIIDFVTIYVEYLSKYVNIPSDLKVYVMEKKNPTYDSKNDIKKDGIHIMLPGYLVPNSILHEVRKNCIEDKRVAKIFKLRNLKTSFTLSDIIDEHVIETSSWFLYGSGKPNDLKYEISNVYSISLNEDDIEESEEEETEDEISDDDLDEENDDFDEENFNIDLQPLNSKPSNIGSKKVDLKSIKKPSVLDCIKNLSNLFVNKNIEVNDEKYLKQSIKPSFQIDIGNNYASMMCQLPPEQLKKPESEVYTPEYLSNLINCISPTRADTYDTWWKIGQSLYNIDFRNFEIWNNFSQKSEKYEHSECRAHWKKFSEYHMKYHSLHINYLRQLAKQDNPKNLAKIDKFLQMEVINEILDEFKIDKLTGKENAVGTATFAKKLKRFIETLGDKHYYISITDGNKRTWFTFENHKWKEDPDCQKIKSFLMNELLEKFKNYKEKLQVYAEQCIEQIEQINEEKEENNSDDIFSDNRKPETKTSDIRKEKEESAHRARTCLKIANFLESQTRRNELIKDLGILYNEPHFNQKLDTTINVFVCKNGVLDLDPKNITFRNGKPEDMMMRSTDVSFITMDDILNNPDYQDDECELQEFLDKIFPDPELQEYFLNIIAETLDGDPKRQELYVATGSGSNGKSIIFGFLQKVFGAYAGKTQPTILTRKRNESSSANPEVYDLRGKRLVYCEEPDENESFKTGILKELTGGDYITARTLYKENITFKPQFKLFISCNDKPEIPATDDGTWRRIKVLPFMSKFVESCDYRLDDKEKYPYFYPKQDVTSKFSRWIPIFLSMLFERYKQLAKKNFKYPEPACVLAAVNEYKSQQNYFATFRQDRMVEAPGERLDIREAFEDFIKYARESNFSIKECNKNSFKTNMERIIGAESCKGKYWKNWTLADWVTNSIDHDENADSDKE